MILNQKFSEQLSHEEFLKYFMEYQNGNKKYRKIIINHNLKLVKSRILKRFFNTPYDVEDLFQIGVLGLIKSIDTYDCEKNVAFSTYATTCIDNEILLFIRKNQKSQNDVSLYDNISNFRDDEEAQLINILSDTTIDIIDNYEYKETIKIVKNIINRLPERSKEIVTLFFNLNGDREYTQEELASKYHTTRSNIAMILQNALNTIREELKKQDFIINKPKSKSKYYK